MKRIPRHIAVLLSKGDLTKNTAILRIVRLFQERHGLIVTTQPIKRTRTIAHGIRSIDGMGIQILQRITVRFPIDQKRTQSNGNIRITFSLFACLEIPLQQNDHIALAMLSKPHARKTTKGFEIRRLPREYGIEIGRRRVEVPPLERNVRATEPVVDATEIKINSPRRRNVGVDQRTGVFEKVGQKRISVAESIVECDRQANIGQRFGGTTKSHVRQRAVVAWYRTLRKLPDCEPIIPKRLDQIVPLGRKVAVIHPVDPRHIDQSSIAKPADQHQYQQPTNAIRKEKPHIQTRAPSNYKPTAPCTSSATKAEQNQPSIQKTFTRERHSPATHNPL